MSGKFFISSKQQAKKSVLRLKACFRRANILCSLLFISPISRNLFLMKFLMSHSSFQGSTYKRKASKREREKNSPTFKDLDFMEMHSEGIFLQPDLHASLRNSIQRDCTVLESFKIMDYSLLIGIHNVDLAARDKEGGGPENQASEQPSSMTTHQAGVSDAESSSTGEQIIYSFQFFSGSRNKHIDHFLVGFILWSLLYSIVFCWYSSGIVYQATVHGHGSEN